ncbi:MAG: beta strand repeat-containing protein, partial [Rhodoluna sp.]
GRAGSRFTTQPIVTIQDRYGNTVTDGEGSDFTIHAAATITAQNGVALTTPLDIQASNADEVASAGVATFGALTISGLVTNTYALTYSIDMNGISVVTQPNVTISYGVFDHLTVRTQPAGGNATASLLSTQPVIELRDGSGNLVANASSTTVTVTIDSVDGRVLRDASLARLDGASKVSANGVVTFDQLKLYGLPGTNYALKFAVNSRFVTANPISVTHAVANHLTITQQPTGGNATGANLAGQPVVELRDLYENVVTSNSTDVLTARIATTAGVSLAGNTTATFANGVATFAGLKVIALPATDYTLDFTTTVASTAFTTAATSAFQVTYSTPTQLAVVQQPVGATTGTQLATQPIVEVRDMYGNRVYNFVGNITAAVGGAGSTLTSASSADLSAVVTDGRATFTDLALTATPATDYQLTFTSGSLAAANSNDVRVIPGAPVRILILNQPIGANTGAELTGQPVVKVVDSFGNTVTQDNSTVITAAISSGTGGVLTRVVSGSSVPVTATVTNGVATFSHLVMRGLTTQNYKLTFTSDPLASAESASYTVHHASVVGLAWRTQPQVDMTGSPLTRAAVLELQDMDGNIADTDNSTVVTAIVSTGVGGSLTSASATAAHGVVTFANLTLTGTPGVSYKLTFRGTIGGSTVTALESDALTPVHAVPAKLTMRGGNVTGGLSGQLLVNQPSLYVRDRFNNIATSDNTTVVTASVLNDVTGTVAGQVTATAVNGVVTFAGLKLAGDPGTPYSLNFAGDWSGTTLTTTASNTFTVSKVADVSLAYTAQDYVPNAVVPAIFSTDSPGAITFTTNSSSLICTLDPGTGDLTIKGAGNCDVRVDLDQDADGFYLANYAEARLVISKAQQAPITITSSSTVDYWSTVNPVATGGSGTGALSYQVVAGSTCRLIGATILPGDAGSLCQITASRAGDSNYLPATSPVQTIVVRKINQAALTIASPDAMSVDNLSLFTAGGSGTGAVTYSLVSAGTAHCSISGSILSATAAGTCSIRATKAASTNYNAVTSVSKTIRVTKDDQTVMFTTNAPMYPVVSGSYEPIATATSGLVVNFTIATNSAGQTCEFDATNPAKVNFTAVGICELVATQAGSSRYAVASVRQIINVGLMNQSITFPVIPDLTFGTPAFKIAPTTNAGNSAPITLATTSNNVACTLNGNILTMNSAGYCEIKASQSGYGAYAAATDVIRGFNVLPDLAGAPQIYSSSVTTHALTAAFTAPSYTGGSAVTGYVLIATDVNGNSYENAACPVTAGSVTCTIVGLPNDVAYTAVARAITSAGRGAVSNVTVSQTPVDAPLAVTNLAAATSNNNLVVTWTPPTALDGTFLRYDVYVAPIGSDLPTTTPYSVTDPNATTTTIQNILAQSSTSTATPTPTPTITTASARVSFRRASITSPTPTPSPSSSGQQNNVSAPAGYQVRIVTITSSRSVAATDNSTNGFQTNFEVPLSPQQLTLTPSGADLMISWSAPTADGGSTVTGYDVKVNGTTVCAATTDLFCNFTPMVAGQTYNVQV